MFLKDAWQIRKIRKWAAKGEDYKIAGYFKRKKNLSDLVIFEGIKSLNKCYDGYFCCFKVGIMAGLAEVLAWNHLKDSIGMLAEISLVNKLNKFMESDVSKILVQHPAEFAEIVEAVGENEEIVIVLGKPEVAKLFSQHPDKFVQVAKQSLITATQSGVIHHSQNYYENEEWDEVSTKYLMKNICGEMFSAIAVNPKVLEQGHLEEFINKFRHEVEEVLLLKGERT
jgi:hypothetical protein